MGPTWNDTKMTGRVPARFLNKGLERINVFLKRLFKVALSFKFEKNSRNMDKLVDFPNLRGRRTNVILGP
jgi:hypothetical protein